MTKRVLIADDAAMMRAVLKTILLENGYAIAGEAADGSEAVTKYFELKPDLMTMDIVMPECDGVTAVRAILSQDPNARIVMCSSMGQQALVVEAMHAGAKGFLTKPFASAKLLETLKRVAA